MPGLYVKLDAHLDDDAKIAEVGPFGELVYVRSLRMAKRAVSDGVLTPAQVRRLTWDLPDPIDPSQVVESLVAAGLWVPAGDGFQIAAWLDHNESKAELESRQDQDRARAASRQRAKRDRDRVTATSRDLTAVTDTASQDTETDRETETEREGDAPAPPTSVAHPIPDPFTVGPDLVDWADEHAPTVDLPLETRKFAAHYRSTGALRTSWVEAWRLWMLRAVEHDRPPSALATNGGGRL